MSTLGDRLRELRKEARKSQKEFGVIFGLSESAIGMYERNQRKPDYDTLEKFANYFNTDVNYLVTGEKVRKQEKNSKLTEKDEKDIAKRLEEFRNDLENQDGLLFSGEPMSEEAKESLMEAMEYVFRQTQRINKKYIPKKYRKDSDVD